MGLLTSVKEAFNAVSSNHREEAIQRHAWKLVRSAYDRMGADRGKEKRDWCIERLVKAYTITDQEAEDHIRAAYMTFKAERAS